MPKLPFRLQYFLRRAVRLRPKNLIGYAQSVQKLTPRTPRLFIIVDMLWCTWRYDMLFQNYIEWDFRLLKNAERKTWMPEARSFRYSRELNDPIASRRTEDKSTMYEDLHEFLHREWLDLRRASDDEWTAFLGRNHRFVVKPLELSGGHGVDVIEQEPGEDPAALRARLVAADQVLVEGVLAQHPEMNRLYAGSVNTIRLITYYDEKTGVVHVLNRAIRIGNGGVVDNFHSGGMYTLLDEHGRILYPALDKNDDVFAVHPATGVPIVGFQVPEFDEITAMIDRAARGLPGMHYIGWDVAVTPEGPAIVEANNNTGVFQPKPSATGVRTGLLPVYQAAIGY